MAEPIDRVRKLRALAERTTFPAEAESALAKANRLMEEHQLTEETVTGPKPFPHPPMSWGSGSIVTRLLKDMGIDTPQWQSDLIASMLRNEPMPDFHFNTFTPTTAQTRLARDELFNLRDHTF